ncbi:MAG: protein phosphatase 2C domain-containing protein [Tannerellaceae bacterium]|jgi:protein phosphatase|nr:protein phosphatase 2C domain-containing protein [Tannerellaceae bacterium]
MKITIRQPLSYTHIGRKENQEDQIYPLPGKATADDRFFILCDGMGGHEDGEIASQTVCQTIGEFFQTHPLKEGLLSKELLNEALEKAYLALDEKDKGALRKMGTTFTFIGLHAGGCLAAHIGDSRIYHIRPGKGLLYQSADHSLVNELLKAGEITAEEAINHPQKNVLSRVMQPCSRRKAETHQLSDIQSGDYFFLCSDGVLEQLTNEQLLSILSDTTLSDKEKAEKLEAVSRDKTKDNYTAYLIPIDQVEPEANDSASSENNKLVMATAMENKKTKKENKAKMFTGQIRDFFMSLHKKQ